MLGPTLHTPRLVLRPPTAEDFEPFAAFCADEHAMRYLGGTQGRNVAWRSWATVVGAWTVRGYSMFSVIERKSGTWLGRIGPWMPEGWPGTEVGWGVVRAVEGKGYAFEAATAAIDWAFHALGFHDVIHCIAPENARSIALAQRLGSSLRESGVTPPAPLTGAWSIYGQTREQWVAARGR